jgi:hypothetical protein
VAVRGAPRAVVGAYGGRGGIGRSVALGDSEAVGCRLSQRADTIIRAVKARLGCRLGRLGICWERRVPHHINEAVSLPAASGSKPLGDV